MFIKSFYIFICGGKVCNDCVYVSSGRCEEWVWIGGKCWGVIVNVVDDDV